MKKQLKQTKLTKWIFSNTGEENNTPPEDDEKNHANINIFNKRTKKLVFSVE